MPDIFWTLQRTQLFERLSREDLALLELGSRVKAFAPKQLVYLPQDQADAVLLLASGRVKLYAVTPDGKQALLTLVDPGELFGSLPLSDAPRREEFAEAMEHSTILLIPASNFSRLVERNPTLSLALHKLAGLRLRRLERRLKYLLFRSNRDRLVALLLELVEQYPVRKPEGLEIGLKLSHQELSGLIGSTRESVTVSLGELQNLNLLTIERRRVILRDLPALARLIQEAPPKIPDSPPLKPPKL